MAYTSALTSALSGATLRQLSYWRRETNDRGPLLRPELGTRPRAIYSYQDLVALRMFVHLRERASLQQIRKAVRYLEEQHPETHMAMHRLAADPMARTIVWLSADGEYFDVVAQPGQRGFEVVMDQIFRSFETAAGRWVPDLAQPTKGLRIDPDVRGGWPVIAGTRIPFHIIASLHADGVSSSEIAELYPKVTAREVRGATEFADFVATVASPQLRSA